MGVYIKGMEMPERCWDCDLCYDSFYCKGLEVQFSDREDSEPSERRLSDCPLVPVPPHGRCIDADELFKEMERKGWFDNADRGKAEDLVLDAPTIIPAELPVHHGTFAATSEKEALERIIPVEEEK